MSGSHRGSREISGGEQERSTLMVELYQSGYVKDFSKYNYPTIVGGVVLLHVLPCVVSSDGIWLW